MIMSSAHIGKHTADESNDETVNVSERISDTVRVYLIDRKSYESPEFIDPAYADYFTHGNGD